MTDSDITELHRTHSRIAPFLCARASLHRSFFLKYTKAHDIHLTYGKLWQCDKHHHNTLLLNLLSLFPPQKAERQSVIS